VLFTDDSLPKTCESVLLDPNPHLATIVAQIGRDATSRADIANQIDVWRQNNIPNERRVPRGSESDPGLASAFHG
jgi:nuclear pore complex protein Nup98-Nup96